MKLDHALGELTSVHVRHTHVGQEQIDVAGCMTGELEGFERIRGRDDDIPRRLQNVLGQAANIGPIVDHEDRGATRGG
jgi:hypothetical protein